MWCRLVLVVVLLSARVHCEEEEEEAKDLRSAKEFNLDGFRPVDNEKWHAVDYQQDTEDWAPSQTPSEEEPVMKRRRPGRKRKRRPQTSEREFYSDDDRLPSRTRVRRPQRLDTRRENWRDEMMAEEPFRPIRNYSRRRQYPKYEDEEEIEDDQPKSTESIIEKIRDPYTALNQDQVSRRRPYKRKHLTDEQEPVTEKEVNIATDRVDISPSSTHLKTLLKQSGGISLSELLQQKNLSLADLLKGEHHAISALTSIPEQTSEPYNINEMRKHNSGHRRLPPVRKYTKANDDDFTTTKENLTSQKIREHKYESKQSEIETESTTTDRRIFVPSHPKYYTSVDYKPNMKELNIVKTTSSVSTATTPIPEQTSESISIVSSTITFSTSENPTVKIKNQIKARSRFTLPPTYAKLKNLAAKTTIKSVINNDTENYPKLSTLPPKAVKINFNDLFGVSKFLNDDNNNVIATSISTSTTTEGPMKISVDLEQILKKSKQSENNSIIKDTDINEIENKEKISPQDSDEENEKIKELSAKDEIMEILSDSVSRENLTRLLELRNMTLEELVEQRERGSSQRHLADIFHNKTKEPEPSEETIIDQIIKTDESSLSDTPSIFDTFPKFNNRPDNIIPLNPIKQSRYYSSIMELPSKTRESRENQFSTKDSDEYNFINNPMFDPIFRTTTGKSNEILGKIVPVWRQAYTNVQNNNEKLMLPDKFLEDDLILKDEAQRIEDIENKLAEAVNGAFNIDVTNHKTYDDEDENEFFRLPYGVRSAIIASAVIIGISLIIFLTIFIIFKWTQRQRQQLTYTNSFSSSKIKTPILETPYQRRIFGSIMNATLGRKKKIPTISCSEPQSLQEYLWETDRKPFQ